MKNNAFFFLVTRGRTAVTHSQVLQLTFATLVANGAIEGVVDEQKLHDCFLSGHGFV